MTARPGNWSLLTDGTDPVPGDPDAVRTEASYYGDMADTIRDEANRLRTLGQDGELVGKYTKSLQEELGDLADEVGKAHQRYEGVGTALKPYASALDNAKAESWGALQDAITAHDAQATANGMADPQPTGSTPLTAAQKTAQTDRASAINTANDALTRARNRLHNALTDLDSAAKKAANEINDQSNDSLKDHHHWWDVVIKIIKVVVEILTYVVIVLAIAAIFCAGLGFAMLIISAVIFALDLTLALTGNGSWMDVAIDVVGLLTCGIGTAASKGGGMAAKSGLKAATKLETKESGRELGLLRRVVTYAGRKGAATTKVTDFTEDAAKGLSRMAGLSIADREMAENLAKLDALAGRYTGSAKIASRLAIASKLGVVTRVGGYTGLSAVLGNTLFSPSNLPLADNVKPYNHNFADWKDSYVQRDRAGHAYDFKWNDLDYSPSSLLERAGPRVN